MRKKQKLPEKLTYDELCVLDEALYFVLTSVYALRLAKCFGVDFDTFRNIKSKVMRMRDYAEREERFKEVLEQGKE